MRGWSRRPRTGREYALLKRGEPEPRRREGVAPPCRACGSRASRLRNDPRVKGGKTRECIACEARSGARGRRKHRARVNAYQRAWIRAKRARARQELAA